MSSYLNMLIYSAFFLCGIHLINALSLFLDSPSTNFLNIGLAGLGFCLSFFPWLRSQGDWIIPMQTKTRLDLLIAAIAIKSGLAITWLVGR